MQIVIQTVPPESQRYATVGDYFFDENGVRQIRVSDLGNPDFEFLVALHELVEQHLCQKAGIPDEAIDRFDKEFEAHRHPDNDDEPGDDKEAPYYAEHQCATAIERVVAAMLEVDWKDYEARINSLT